MNRFRKLGLIHYSFIHYSGGLSRIEQMRRIGSSTLLVRLSDSIDRPPQAAAALRPLKRGATMLWTILVVLGILWLLGFSFHVGGSLIHLLLVVGLVILVVNALRGRRLG